MSQETFPFSAKRVVATVAELFRIQGKRDLAELLTTAGANIEATGYGGWNDGTTFYTLYLEVPVALYARLEAELTEIENAIASKVQGITRKTTENDVLNAVVISPTLEEAMPDATPVATDPDDNRLWDPGMLRLFTSHVATHRVAVSALKSELRLLGVSGFVAHEDIEPSLEWQGEIELGLRTMHAMTALLTPEFDESKWTDQEIGVAVARGALVISVRLGLNPYGFIAKSQALPGDLAKPRELASALVGILAKRPSTGEAMREGLVVALESSSSFAASKVVSTMIESIVGFSPGQIARLEESIEENDQVAGSYGVPARLKRVIAGHASAAE